MLWTRIQNDQILDSADDAPVARRINFALIATVKPSLAQNFRGLLGAIPIAGKNIRPAHQNFLIGADFHFDAGHRRANRARFDVARIVHGADGGGFR
jgi:hypothetical protein